MWSRLAKFILRQRVPLLLFLALSTAFMAWKAQDVKLQWGLPKLLPDNDSTVVAYEEFRQKFGGESTVFLLGIEEDPLGSVQVFNDWLSLGKSLTDIDGVNGVIALNRLYNLKKDVEHKQFLIDTIVTNPIQTELELDSIRSIVYNLPFYKGAIYNDTSGVNVMGISLNTEVFNSKARSPLVDSILLTIEDFEQASGLDIHYSGLPFIRTFTTRLIKKELRMFVLMAFLVTVFILFLFFRSIYPVVVSVLIVAMGVVWSLGTLALLDYEITILTSIIPPLIIVIGVPNSVYLINKYHAEYINHRNKVLALTRVVTKIGKATLLTNFTTAIGFLAFVFTNSQVLVEFGIVASINIMVLFILSISIIPAMFSFLPPPAKKQTKHLDQRWVKRFVEGLIFLVTNRRKQTYVVSAFLVIAGFVGVSFIETTGNLVDDLPKTHFVVQDLKFFEKHFNGVMPLEISIDTKGEGRAMKASTLKRIDRLESVLQGYPELSKPLSVVDGIKFIKQGYYGGSPAKYQLINGQERVFFKPYLENAGESSQSVLDGFVDSTRQYARVTVQMADVGTIQMDSLLADLRTDVDALFPADKYDVDFTGTSVVYLKGTTYLVNNLFTSLVLAIIIIAFIMALLFSSVRMIAISIFTNLIPLLLTAALMGYFSIPIKPSTILVFSIAFGISIDDTIHFLAKYRQELKSHHWNIGVSVVNAIRETGVSMMYTSIILFFGFSVFASSNFGGTQALGILVSFTLLAAMLANLVLLPSFLMTLDKSITTKAFKEPLLEIFDEEEDIELGELTIRKA